MGSTIDTFWDGSTILGECPLWDDRLHLLYWIDIDGKAVHRQSLDGNHQSHSLDGRPGSIALTPNPAVLLVAIEHQLQWLDWDSGVAQPWLDLEEPRTKAHGNRLNDGRCDRQGRFWVGSMHDPTASNLSTGNLHQVNGDGSTAVMKTGIGVSNGLAFSPDGSVMYFADSPRQTIWAYNYDGTPQNKRVFVDTTNLRGFPDGATVDADGCYWMAGVRGGCLHRFTPDGTLDRTVDLPVMEPTMCAFGGPDLSTLFVTSFGPGKTRGPKPAGSILALDVGVVGIQEPIFSGDSR